MGLDPTEKIISKFLALQLIVSRIFLLFSNIQNFFRRKKNRFFEAF